MSRFITSQECARIHELTRGGLSVRAIVQTTGHAKTTVIRYRNACLADHDIRCQCGEKIKHQNWCRFRVLKSPRRKQFLSVWHTRGTCASCRGPCFGVGRCCEMCWRGQSILERAERLLVPRKCKICEATITASPNNKTCRNEWCKRIYAFYYVEGRNRPPTVRGGKTNGLRFELFLSDYIRRLADGCTTR